MAGLLCLARSRTDFLGTVTTGRVRTPSLAIRVRIIVRKEPLVLAPRFAFSSVSPTNCNQGGGLRTPSLPIVTALAEVEGSTLVDPSSPASSSLGRLA